jgi:hypothetical protein
MASAVADLEAGLQAMAGMKPPGVSGSRIASLTSLCVANIQARPLPSRIERRSPLTASLLAV